jgi:translation initiation factor 4A
MEVKKFDDLNLKKNLLRGIYSYGFEKPSAIQCKAIPELITGTDIIAQAQSGTGKTGAFTIGALQKLDESIKATQVLIVSPTHELTRQTAEVVKNISQFMDNVTMSLVIGGTSVRECRDELEKSPSIVVGTPGRILDMIQRKSLYTTDIDMVIFDEADEILSKGFKETIVQIIRFIKKDAQICLFSATMPDEIIEISKHFMNEPKHLLVKKEELTLEGIKQFFINVKNNEWKFDTLFDIYESISVSHTIIYCNSKRRVEDLANNLQAKGFPVASIHGEMSSEIRKDIMDRFRKGDSRILIATDLLARGIDIQQVSLVINFDIPNNMENYIHRIGRSGRYGRKGVSINFVTDYEAERLKEIETFYNTSIEELPMDFSKYLQ